MGWNYDMESCPLDTKVRLLSSGDCLLLPQAEYVGTITFNGRYRERGKLYVGDPEYFYRSAIVAWKQYRGNDMDNDLIKALRCIASRDSVGDCHADRCKFLRKDNEPKMYCSNKVWGDETMQCPYYQDKYETCFEDGACGEWLNEIADILESYNAKVERLEERLREYETGKTPTEEVYMIETAHGRRCIDVQGVLKIIDEIFERKE